VTFAPPTVAAELAAFRALAAELGAASSEAVLVGRALDIFGELLPGRALCVRVLDIRTREPANGYLRGAPMRQGALAEGVTITEAALSRAKLKLAVAASARLVIRDRWDSPFTGIATGFAIPLAAAGELYGVLDVGYAPSADAGAVDEPSMQAFAEHLAIALRTLRLSDDALGLRDYQARLLDNANALILGVDRGWRITACNRALLELINSTREDVLGRDVRDFITAEQRQYLTGAFAAALAGQHHAAVTVALPTRKHGTVRTVWTIAPVGRAGVAGGPIEAVVAIGQDMSQIEALQQQVVRAERLATLGELAAGVVHELNNPLTSITVYAEYLVRKLEAQGAEPSDVEKLRRIGASAQRILARQVATGQRLAGVQYYLDRAGLIEQLFHAGVATFVGILVFIPLTAVLHQVGIDQALCRACQGKLHAGQTERNIYGNVTPCALVCDILDIKNNLRVILVSTVKQLLIVGEEGVGSVLRVIDKLLRTFLYFFPIVEV
jgi:PAS domain S-box-containing protein